MLSVIFYFACVGSLLSLSLLGPIGVALLGGDWQIAQRFCIYLVLAGFLFYAPIIAIRDRLGPTPQVARLTLVIVVWTVLPVFAAVPFMDIAGLDATDAFFEAVSGITTTGATTLKTVEVWPQALVFWRAQLQWIGGYLGILTIVMIVAPLGIGGLTARTAALINKGDLVEGQGRVLGFAGNLGLIYLTVTAACIILLFLSGHRAFYAVTLSMTAVSTGGFLPFDGSLDEVASTFGLIVIAAFLLLGATSVFWQRMVLKGRVSRIVEHRESYFVLGLAGLLSLVFAFNLAQLYGGGLEPFGNGLVEGFLAATSLVATSGIESRPGIISLLPLVLVLFVILVGGSAYSTSGGIKQYRIGGMLVQSWSELDRLIYPHGIRPTRFGSQRYDLGLIKAIWSFFIAAIGTIALGCIVLSATGLQFEASLTATIAAFATAGPIYLAGWEAEGAQAWPHYADMTDTAKYALMVTMILGRVEVLTVIGLISTRYWRSR